MYRIGGRLGDGDASPRGAFVGIPPLRDWSSNPDREGRGPCQVGSLTGAVASQRVTEAPQRYPQIGWKSIGERKCRRVLDCETYKSSRDESRD